MADAKEDKGLILRLKDWAMHPITTPMDMFDVVLTSILISTVIFAWWRVMVHIQDSGE